MPSSSPSSDFRLSGHHQGQALRFDLAIGEATLGSAVDCDVLLPFPGVSRRHALLRVQAEGLVVEDLESKNGTFIDGQRVVRAAAGDGARLAFGPVELEISSTSAPELAIRFDAGTDESSLSALERSTLLLKGLPAGRSDDALASLDALTAELEREDLDRLLHRLSERLEAAGSALVEWDAAGAPLALASCGQLGELPALALIRELPVHRAKDGDWFSGRFDGGTVTARLADEPGRRGLALVVWRRGDIAALAAQRILVRIMLLSRRLGDLPDDLASDKASSQLDELELRFPPGYVIGQSERMRGFYRQMAAVSRLRAPVLLRGETGVGKEMLARALHDSVSPQAPYIVVNCAAISPELMEAEMFGVTKGAATGVDARRGYFARADGGTLFLDEIGELAQPLQAKLLRTLQEGEIQPVGGAPQRVEVRVIAATNVDLEGGALRRDLYYRLAAGLLEVPPLRETRDDVPRLVRHFLQRASLEMNTSLRGVTARALEALCAYPWPGNIRELAFVMRRIGAQRPPGGIVDLASLPPSVRRPTVIDEAPAGLELKPQVEALERRLIREAMIRANGRQIEAAKLLGVSRSGLAKMLDRLGLRDSWARPDGGP